ncbi:hypothetical protein LCGC14_0354920 [marine sediment metagenome]|uniref:Uncharacterized protein n=1 Tax=marine sediment metagenome TaxID=412755 RepID=A0A0F9TSJ4_9ZZZZ
MKTFTSFSLTPAAALFLAFAAAVVVGAVVLIVTIGGA